MFHQLERDAQERICERIKQIGEADPSDVARLAELARIGRDVEAIERAVASTVGKSQDEVRRLLNAAAEAEWEANKSLFDVLGVKWTPFQDNPLARELVVTTANAISANIADMAGLSKSVSGTLGFLNTAGANISMAEYYQNTVDYALMQVRTGQTDFYSAMRKAVNNLADNGMCFSNPSTGRRSVGYESGYNRRLDSSVRNAFSGGQQRMSRQLAEMQGAQFGADGMEISWHAGARPSHMDFAGKQYNMKAYHEVCVPLLNDFNCYHRAFPIVLGVSTPAYSSAELNALNAAEDKAYVFDGRSYNAYEARQRQRQYETAIRRQKDRAVCLAAAGDKNGATLAKAKASAINQNYKRFSDAVHLKPKPIRASVRGYTRGASLQSSPKGGIIGSGGRMLQRDISKEVRKPMDEKKFLKIRAAFERNGGVMKSSVELDRYLDLNGADAVTFNAKTIVLRQGKIPTASELFEELIHTSQFRGGDVSINSTVEFEIEAKTKLIKYQKQYGIPDSENEQTKKQLEFYKQQLSGGKE